jgi:hypothetical protein
MRAEVEEKGYVELDDNYIARRVFFREAEEAEAEARTEEWVDAFGPMEGHNARRSRKPEGKVLPST